MKWEGGGKGEERREEGEKGGEGGGGGKGEKGEEKGGRRERRSWRKGEGERERRGGERKVCMCRSADDTRDARWISLVSPTMKA